MKPITKVATNVLLIVLLALTITPGTLAQNETSELTVYFFWGDGCPHCEEQKPYMEELKTRYPDVKILMYETWKNPENAQLFQEVAKAYETTARGVPTTFIGGKHWVGFADSMKTEMTAQIEACLEQTCPDPYKQAVTPSQEETKQSEDLCAHVFLDYSCDECDQSKAYIESLNLNDVSITYHNVNNETEKTLYEQFKNAYGLKIAGYPIVFIGENYFIGLDSIEKNLENVIEECKDKSCPCPASTIKGTTPSMPRSDYKPEKTETLQIPLVGEVEIGKMPLFVMTALIAFVDGFNPCSLWVLTFLLGIVIYTRSRKKIFLVGLTFLLITSAAYGLFMLGLLNVFTYIGYTLWIRIAVAAIATLFAVVNIKDYFWYKKGLSFTISDKYKPKLFKKVRNIMNPNKSTTSMLIGTALMALGIVLVELPCTAGFPMIWTNIVSQHEVSSTLFIWLFLLYMLIYLIDELVVFSGVALTLKASKFEEKHGRILKLVGGVIMLALAFAMLFMPQMMNTISGSVYLFGAAGIVSYLVILIHRKVLPRLGIKIGTETMEHKDLHDKKKKDESEDEKK